MTPEETLKKIDPEITKKIPKSPHKKEVATFTMRGMMIVIFAWIAWSSHINNNAWWIQTILWIVFAINLFQLGAEYSKVLARPDEENLLVFRP